MKILSVSIKNYKSIRDSGKIDLHNTLNALAGKNNTGKSAFIEAIYKVTHGELADYLSSNFDTVDLVMDINLSDEEISLLNTNVYEEYILFKFNHLRLTYLYDVKTNKSYIERIDRIVNDECIAFYYSVTNDPDIKYRVFNKNQHYSVNGIPTFFKNIHEMFKDKVIYINGSRYVQPTERTNLQNYLQVEGANLNALIYTLNNNAPRIFTKINESFKQIFNDVSNIGTPINENDQTYISIYFEGMDMPIPLSQCGSGYTHVLLLLCVLFNKEHSVVLFDEPHVFLHPSAEKAIYDLVSENKEHQYIFTTHSPILINYPVEKRLVHVSKSNGNSYYTHLEHIQEVLSDIGVNNSDFALSDKVIFVEGQTEEQVFPMILSYFGLKQIGYNYRILNMKGTGKNFSKKTAMREHKDKLDLVLSGVSQSPIPYKIIIDADDKADGKLLELRESYGDNLIILDRREYENYFLECYQELFEVINQDSSTPITDKEQIKDQVEKILSLTDDLKLFPKGSTDALKNVVGSEVLERLFRMYSLNYNKIVHGMELTQLVLNNTPEKLEFFKNELQDFIKG